MSQEDEGEEDLLATIKRIFPQQPSIVEEKEEDIEYDDAAVDDAMSNHQMLASDDSPYANEMEIAFIREVSIASKTI